MGGVPKLRGQPRKDDKCQHPAVLDLRAYQVDLFRRALALLDANSTEPGVPASSPMSRYLDPARHALEVKRIFRHHPVAVCPSASFRRSASSCPSAASPT